MIDENDLVEPNDDTTLPRIKSIAVSLVEATSTAGSLCGKHRVFPICLYLFHNETYSTAKRKKQRNKKDKANSSYSRPKKQKNENESSYNKY